MGERGVRKGCLETTCRDAMVFQSLHLDVSTVRVRVLTSFTFFTFFSKKYFSKKYQYIRTISVRNTSVRNTSTFSSKYQYGKNNFSKKYQYIRTISS